MCYRSANREDLYAGFLTQFTYCSPLRLRIYIFLEGLAAACCVADSYCNSTSAWQEILIAQRLKTTKPAKPRKNNSSFMASIRTPRAQLSATTKPADDCRYRQ